MDKRDIAKVSFWNDNNVEMVARHFKPSDNCDEVLLYIAGIGGTYGELGDKLSDMAAHSDMSFLWPMLEDTYDRRETNYKNENGEIQRIKIGATWATLRSTCSDFDAIFKYIKQCGYKKISLVSVCGSCSKSIYYTLQNPEFKQMLNRIVLLAPVDYRMIDRIPKNAGLREEAIHNLKDLRQNKLLSKDFIGYMKISSKTYLEYLYLDEYNTLPYLDDDSKLEALQSIKTPTLIFMGQFDRAIKYDADFGKAKLDRLAGSFGNARYAVVKGANHLFNDRESQVVNMIDNFVNHKQKNRRKTSCLKKTNTK